MSTIWFMKQNWILLKTVLNNQVKEITFDFLNEFSFIKHVFLFAVDLCNYKTYFVFFSLIKYVFESTCSLRSSEKSSGDNFHWKMKNLSCLCFHISCHNKLKYILSLTSTGVLCKSSVHSYSLPHWKKLTESPWYKNKYFTELINTGAFQP